MNMGKARHLSGEKLIQVFLYSGLVLMSSNYICWSQTGESNSAASQASPTPSPTPVMISPASPDEVQKLRNLLTKPATPTDPNSPAPQNYQIYHIFFMHLANFDSLAAKLEANGKKADGLRTHDQRLAGLTVEEGALVKKVAYDCNQQVAAVEKRFQEAVAEFRQQHSNDQFPLRALPPDLQQLWARRAQIINSEIDQLQILLGQTSFQKLDNWVQANFRPVRQSVPVPSQMKSPSSGQGPSQ
jgi:hypothetical protein